MRNIILLLIVAMVVLASGCAMHQQDAYRSDYRWQQRQNWENQMARQQMDLHYQRQRQQMLQEQQRYEHQLRLEQMREQAKWERRVNLAREQGKDDLLRGAEEEMEKITKRRIDLENEAADLGVRINNLKQQLSVLPAKERSIDPDLLEQELLILSGRMPGDEKEAERDRAFEKLERDASVDSALEELKAKMGK